MTLRLSAKKYYAKLVRWAELANLITPEIEARQEEINQINRGLNFRNLPAPESNRQFSEMKERLAEWDRLCEPFARSLAEAFPALEPRLPGWRAFEVIRGVRDTLRALAFKRTKGRWIPPERPVASLPASLPLMVRIDDHGEFEAVRDFPDELLGALVKRAANRLRICPVCGGIFVALRKDQSAHSGKCTWAYNGRRWRERKREYEAHRERNQQARQVKQERDARHARAKERSR